MELSAGFGERLRVRQLTEARTGGCVEVLIVTVTVCVDRTYGAPYPYRGNSVIARRGPATCRRRDLWAARTPSRVLQAPWAMIYRSYTRRLYTLFSPPHFARFPLLELLPPCGDVCGRRVGRVGVLFGLRWSARASPGTALLPRLKQPNVLGAGRKSNDIVCDMCRVCV